MRRISLIEDVKRVGVRPSSGKLDVLDWLEIWENSATYFDGDRRHGYGGYHYDGRWQSTVEKLIETFSLDDTSSLLDVGCAKGFLVNDFASDSRVGEAIGLDISLYALIQGKRAGMKGRFFCANATQIPFPDKYFSLVFSKDSLHNILDEGELIAALSEIERVGQQAWIRVGAYNTSTQKQVIDQWATFATSYFSTQKWHELFGLAGYSGHYDWFHPTEIIEDVR